MANRKDTMISAYSAMIHPNQDPSVLSASIPPSTEIDFNQRRSEEDGTEGSVLTKPPPKKLNRFKRAVQWID